MDSALILTTLLLFFLPTQEIRYVKPRDSSPVSCPGQPCLTLDQYAEQTTTYFTTGSTFVFLAGNHTVLNAVNISRISSLILRGDLDQNTTLLFQNEAMIHCEYITNLVIEKLTFLLNYSDENRQISALNLTNSKDILINSSVFQRSEHSGKYLARAIYTAHSTLNIEKCVFKRNSAVDGGAVYAEVSSITLHGNTFVDNRAESQGGAIFLSNCTVQMVTNAFYRNKAESFGGAIMAQLSVISILMNNNWWRVPNSANVTWYCESVTMPLINSKLYRPQHFLIANVTYFYGNEAYGGGAIAAYNGALTILGCSLFSVNRAVSHGGAVYLYHGTIGIRLGASFFLSNTASISGGAIDLSSGIFDLSSSAVFRSNEANSGGAICAKLASQTILRARGKVNFEQNSALDGGGIYSAESELICHGDLYFVGNVAERGGGLWIKGTGAAIYLISVDFINNTANICGGAIYIGVRIRIDFYNFTATGNSMSALCVLENNRLNFIGTAKFSKNAGKFGGGINIFSQNSIVSFKHVVFDSNTALNGGAIYSLYGTKLIFHGITLFTCNTAGADGGALYALGTDITIQHKISFTNNSAKNGGAMYFNSATFLTFGHWINATTSNNYASKYGGSIFYDDAAISTQCSFDSLSDPAEVSKLPYCFINFTQLAYVEYLFNTDVKVVSYNDYAEKDGNFLYGGSLDRCQLRIESVEDGVTSIVPYKWILSFFKVSSHHPTKTKGVTSQPYQLCSCDGESNCSVVKDIQVYRGQEFSIALLALDQLRSPVITMIFSKLSSTARLKINQTSQVLSVSCSTLTYNLYSTQNSEELILYPDGPCRDTGVAVAVVNIIFLPCPNGFNRSNEECVCEEGLKEYQANCIVDKDVYILRNNGLQFWVNSTYKNGSYHGLIRYKTCPTGYCKGGDVNFTLDNPDIQCVNNRSGMLCGACATNYSLMLGSSRCVECSNTYLALLLPFAAAGIALVVFLSILRLTVATGYINSIILFANIVQVNRNLFFISGQRNVLTVFIAWMNLDLGFETCFYDGMTAYAQIWFQFAFPLYVWILICLIIFVSRYSITASKLIGHNPIAVLATLLLMSYTKVLKNIIEVYSSVDLEFPGYRKPVWLKDANVPYLQSRHFLLTVVTSLVLVFLFFPYTLLLLVGYKVYRFSGRKYFRWLCKIKPLLDSYYAPYKIHTRYWTGFLLLVRCVLYIVFSFNSLGGTNKSLFVIIVTFTGMVTSIIMVYKNLAVTIVEGSTYLNLIVLSAATLAGLNSAPLVYSLVGIVFVTMIGIIVYHFHITCAAKSSMWLKVVATFSSFQKQTLKSTTSPPEEMPANISSHDPHKSVTKTVIELREPLLETTA